MNSPASDHNFTSLLGPLVTSEIVQKEPMQVASVLAHEIRNPLTSIYLALEMIVPTISDITDEQKMYIDIIMRGAGRINNLLIDFLTSYKGEELQSEKYSIHQLLDEVLIMVQDRITLKDITVCKNYMALDGEISMNKYKVKIALTNIIINAIEAMPSKIGQLKLITKSTNDKYVVEIQDNGVGISKENLNNIFTPCFTNKPNGMGLGLSATLDILRANQISIDVKSKKDSGTSFILSFNKVAESISGEGL